MYMLGCNYFWMLCEGIYLHTLIVVAVFAEEQHLHWYYLLGWGESKERVTSSRGHGAPLQDSKPNSSIFHCCLNHR